MILICNASFWGKKVASFTIKTGNKELRVGSVAALLPFSVTRPLPTLSYRAFYYPLTTLLLSNGQQLYFNAKVYGYTSVHSIMLNPKHSAISVWPQNTDPEIDRHLEADIVGKKISNMNLHELCNYSIRIKTKSKSEWFTNDSFRPICFKWFTEKCEKRLMYTSKFVWITFFSIVYIYIYVLYVCVCVCVYTQWPLY